MKLKLFWNKEEEILRPACEIINLKFDSNGYIGAILGDYGGLSDSATLSILEEGLEIIHLVKDGKISIGHWYRETFGADIKLDEVKISFLYDESYFDIVSFDQFEKALRFWTEFFQSKPNVDTVQIVDLDD